MSSKLVFSDTAEESIFQVLSAICKITRFISKFHIYTTTLYVLTGCFANHKYIIVHIIGILFLLEPFFVFNSFELLKKKNHNAPTLVILLLRKNVIIKLKNFSQFRLPKLFKCSSALITVFFLRVSKDVYF